MSTETVRTFYGDDQNGEGYNVTGTGEDAKLWKNGELLGAFVSSTGSDRVDLPALDVPLVTYKPIDASKD